MTAPFSMPGRGFRRINRVSRALFSWRASDGSLDAISGQSAVFARASAGGALLDSQGFLNPQAVHSQPRWCAQDDNVDGRYESMGLLLERVRTNAFQAEGEDLGNAAWTKLNVTVTTNDIAAPNRAVTADLLLETVTSGAHNFSRNTPTLTDNTRSTLSFCVRGGLGRDWIRVRTTDKAGTSRDTWFNVTTGAFGTINSGHRVEVNAMGFGWYRVHCSFDSASGGTSPSTVVAFALADGSTATYAGTTTVGFWFWGVQFLTDVEDFGSYQTMSGASTADALSWAWGATAPKVDEELTVLCEFDPLWSRTATSMPFLPGIMVIGLGTFAADGLACLDMFRNDTTAGIRCRLNVNNVNSEGGSGSGIAIPATGTIRALAQIRASGGRHQCYFELNGDTSTAVTGAAINCNGAFWRNTFVYLSTRGNGNTPGQMIARSLKIARGRLTLAQMQALV